MILVEIREAVVNVNWLIDFLLDIEPDSAATRRLVLDRVFASYIPIVDRRITIVRVIENVFLNLKTQFSATFHLSNSRLT